MMARAWKLGKVRAGENRGAQRSCTDECKARCAMYQTDVDSQRLSLIDGLYLDHRVGSSAVISGKFPWQRIRIRMRISRFGVCLCAGLLGVRQQVRAIEPSDVLL